MRTREKLFVAALLMTSAGLVLLACGSFDGAPQDSPATDAADADGGDATVIDGGGPIVLDAGRNDASTDAGASTFDANDGATYGKHVFVSSTLFYAGGGGSPQVVDALCVADAQDAGLAQAADYVGWLVQDPGGLHNPLAKLGTGDGWSLIDGTPIFTGKDAIYTNGPLHAVDENVFGKVVTSAPVWTGTTSDGGTGASCGAWSQFQGTDQGTTGDATRAQQWTDRGATDGCDKRFPIYCFQK